MHAKASCSNARAPKSNTGYWEPKLSRNVARDAANRQQLKQLGWRVLVIWECDIKDLKRLTSALVKFLD